MNEKIFGVIAEQLSVDLEYVKPAAHLYDDLGADSLDLVELVMVLEDAFDIELPGNTEEKFLTVQDVMDEVAKYVR